MGFCSDIRRFNFGNILFIAGQIPMFLDDCLIVWKHHHVVFPGLNVVSLCNNYSNCSWVQRTFPGIPHVPHTNDIHCVFVVFSNLVVGVLSYSSGWYQAFRMISVYVHTMCSFLALGLVLCLRPYGCSTTYKVTSGNNNHSQGLQYILTCGSEITMVLLSKLDEHVQETPNFEW